MFLKYAKENNIEEEEEFKTQLKRVKEEILVQYMYSKLMREATVEEKELEDYYNTNNTACFAIKKELGVTVNENSCTDCPKCYVKYIEKLKNGEL